MTHLVSLMMQNCLSEKFAVILVVLVCCHLSVLVQRNFAVYTHTHTCARVPWSSSLLSLLSGLESLTRLASGGGRGTSTLLATTSGAPPVSVFSCAPVLRDPTSTCSALTAFLLWSASGLSLASTWLLSPSLCTFMGHLILFPTGTELCLLFTNVASRFLALIILRFFGCGVLFSVSAVFSGWILHRGALWCVWDSGLKTLGSLVKDGRVRRERVEPVSAHSQPCLGLSGFMPWWNLKSFTCSQWSSQVFAVLLKQCASLKMASKPYLLFSSLTKSFFSASIHAAFYSAGILNIIDALQHVCVIVLPGSVGGVSLTCCPCRFNSKCEVKFLPTLLMLPHIPWCPSCCRTTPTLQQPQLRSFVQDGIIPVDRRFLGRVVISMVCCMVLCINVPPNCCRIYCSRGSLLDPSGVHWRCV